MNRSAAVSGRDFALVLIVCLAWAGSFLAAAHTLREIPPMMSGALRLGLLAVVVSPLMRCPPSGQWRSLLGLGLLGGSLNFGLSMWAIRLAGDLSSPAIVQQSYVPMAALLAWPLLNERVGWRTGFAIALSFAGVLVLGFDPLVLDRPSSLLLMLGSALSLALATIVSRRLQGLGALNTQGWIAVIGVLPLLAASLLFEPGALAAMASASWKAWAGIAYASLISSLLGYGVYYLLVQRYPIAQITPYLLLSPVMTVALAILFWGDRPGSKLWLGGAMVLGGVLLIAHRALAKMNPPAPDNT